MREDQGELANAVRRERARVEVLDDDPVDTGRNDEPAARDDLRHRLDTEPPHAGRAGQVCDRPAAVAAPVDTLEVAERIEVGADLLRPRDLLGDPVPAVMMRRGD